MVTGFLFGKLNCDRIIHSKYILAIFMKIGTFFLLLSIYQVNGLSDCKLEISDILIFSSLSSFFFLIYLFEKDSKYQISSFFNRNNRTKENLKEKKNTFYRNS